MMVKRWIRLLEEVHRNPRQHYYLRTENGDYEISPFQFEETLWRLHIVGEADKDAMLPIERPDEDSLVLRRTILSLNPTNQ